MNDTYNYIVKAYIRRVNIFAKFNSMSLFTHGNPLSHTLVFYMTIVDKKTTYTTFKYHHFLGKDLLNNVCKC